MAVSAAMPVWEIMVGAQCGLFLLAGVIVLVWMTRPADRLDAMLSHGQSDGTFEQASGHGEHQQV